MNTFPKVTNFVLIILCGLFAAALGHQDSPKSYLSPPKPFFPKSCLDYLSRGSKRTGVYKIYDNNGQSFPVFCDMKSEPGNAWTLVTSWSTKHRLLPQFYSTGFGTDSPVNMNAPNWDLYRLNLARMESIKSHSTHWRSTCSYPTHGVDYRDYVRGNFKVFDIVNYVGEGTCKKVEFVNIRGHVGIHTGVKWWQTTNKWGLHTDSSYKGCGSFSPVAGSVSSEDNFGHYGTVSQNFRCTVNDSATTQWWFGGHL